MAGFQQKNYKACMILRNDKKYTFGLFFLVPGIELLKHSESLEYILYANEMAAGWRP